MTRLTFLFCIGFFACNLGNVENAEEVSLAEITFDPGQIKDSLELASNPILEVELSEENHHHGPFTLNTLTDDHFLLHDLARESIHLVDREGNIHDVIRHTTGTAFSRVIQAVSIKKDTLAILVDKGDRILLFDTNFKFLSEVRLKERCKSFSIIEKGIIVRPVDPITTDDHFIFKVYKWDGKTETYLAPILPIKIPVQEINFKRHDAGFVSYKESFHECIYMIKDEKIDSLICFDFGEFMPDINLLSEDDISVSRALVNGFLRIIDYDHYEGVDIAIISFEQMEMMPRYFAVIRNEKTDEIRFYAFNSKQVPIPHDIQGKILVMDFDLLWKNSILRLHQIDLSEI